MKIEVEYFKYYKICKIIINDHIISTKVKRIRIKGIQRTIPNIFKYEKLLSKYSFFIKKIF